MTNHISRHVLAACALAALAVPQAARAQQKVADAAAALAASEGVETVTVTARRKSENEHNVPISMTVVGGDTLKVNGIQNALKLTELVPSLQVVSFNARNTNISVRGLGTNIGLANDGVESGVGVYVDGVFYPRPAEATFDMPDISTIEELRGPQGTLYGKNTTSGAINITTELPTEQREVKGEFSVGDYGYENAQGTIAGTIDDDAHLLGRLTAFETSRNGFITDVTTDSKVHDFHDYGVRGQALWEPTGDFSLRVIADYNKQRETCCMTVLQNVVTEVADDGSPFPIPRNFYQRATQIGYTPLPVDPFARETDANSPYHEIMEQGGLSAKADYRFGGGFDLTSITAYRFWNWNPDNDSDITSLSVLTRARQADEEKEFTQELRISSPASDTFEYSAGLYYFWEDDHGFGDQFYGKDAPTWVLGAATTATEDALVGVGIDSQSDPRIDSYAAYGQATWHITPQLDLTGGLRYTYEEKTGSFYQNVEGGPDLSTLDPTLVAQILALRGAVGLVNQAYFKVNEDRGDPSGLVTATYKFDDDINAYATFSHGAKSGGLNLAFLPPTTPPIPNVVQPEYEDNYEVGFKAILFDHKLSLNADAFWDNDTNYQATSVNNNTGIIVNYIANIPAVRSRGFEADLHANPFDGLSTYLSGAYTDAIYESYPQAPCPFEKYTVDPNNPGKLYTYNYKDPAHPYCDLSGEPLAAVSKWAFSLGGEYDHQVGDFGLGGTAGYIGADVSYRSSFFSSSDDSIYGKVPGYELTNLRVGLRTDDGHWNLEAWSRNALNTHYYQTIGKVAFNSGAFSALLGDPRTSGLTLRFNY
jgi:iron complex outermembrane recepter protein